MIHTFSYDGASHDLRIATKAWSDFGAHIPLIRSFSYGSNLTRMIHSEPIESPLFPGEPIRYHFGFYALVGALERLGVRIDWAFNIPSALGLAALILSVAALAMALFRSRIVAALSVLLFCCNGSLSFFRFFRDHPLRLATPFDILTNSRFPSFGPWDNGTVTAFWNFNIYTNQRHLGLSFAMVTGLLLMLLSPPKYLRDKPLLFAVGIACCMSILLFFHYPSVFIAGIFCLTLFLAHRHLRIPLLFAALLSLPAVLFLRHVASTGTDIVWEPGYLAAATDPWTLIRFWFDNLGLHLFLIPAGLILAPKKIRRVCLGPLLVLFIIPNLFRFSPDMINNHKFFNYFLIIGNMFSAYAVYTITRNPQKTNHRTLSRMARRTVATVLVVLLTFSGVIDLFPIINDTKGSVSDIAANPDAAYILTHTAPDAVVANSTWFYHPASIAGRAIYSGYTYFTWSYGYDQSRQESALLSVYRSDNLSSLCTILTQQRIEAVELDRQPESYISPNRQFWDSLTPDYENPVTHRTIYLTDSLCSL